jgi:hypothetical protein
MNSELELVKIESLIYESEDSLEEEFSIERSTHTINSGNLKQNVGVQIDWMSLIIDASNIYKGELTYTVMPVKNCNVISNISQTIITDL